MTEKKSGPTRPRVKKPSSPRYRRERRFRPGMIVFGLCIALGGLVAAVIASRPERIDPRAGSKLLPLTAPLALTRTPGEYEIVYKVEDLAAGQTVLSTERVLVRRPFDSRVETHSGPPPGDRMLSVQLTSFGKLSLTSPNAQPSGFSVPPSIAARDLRFAPVLERALELGALIRHERREVGGRHCQVYRAAEPLGSAALERVDTTATEYVDVCVDEAGLMLEEYWVSDGKPLRRRLATQVDESPAIPESAFVSEITSTLSVTQGGGSTREVDPASQPPGEFWLLDTPPSGYTHMGRYAVVPPQGENFSDPLKRGRRLAGVSDVWVKGPDVFVVDQGGTLEGAAVFEGVTEGHAADLGVLGQGELIEDIRMSEARVGIKGGRYVRVAGTLPPDELVRIARSLRKVESQGPLVYIDKPTG